MSNQEISKALSDFNNTFEDIFYREPDDPKSVYTCKLCGMEYRGCWRGQVSYKKHLLEIHGIDIDKPVIKNMEQAMENNKTELRSKSRVDIFPNSFATVEVIGTLVEGSLAEALNEEYKLTDVKKNSVTIFNPTDRTYSIYPNDVIASVTLPTPSSTANIVAQEVSEAFSEVGEFVDCPLCGKKYPNNDDGHNHLRKHMEKEHKVNV